MRNVTLTLIMIAAALTLAPAQSATTWEGYLADQMCGTNWKGEKGEARAKKHTKACGLDESCAASGYGLYTGGTFVKFTEASSPKAKVYLEKTTAKDNIFVKVTGVMDGEKISVTSIETIGVKNTKKSGAVKPSTGTHGGALTTGSCDCCQASGTKTQHGTKDHTCDGACQK